MVIGLAVDRLVFVTARSDVVATFCSPCVSGVVLVGIVVGVLVVAVHDLWVYGLTVFGNCGVDELPTSDGGSNVEAVVLPYRLRERSDRENCVCPVCLFVCGAV